MPNFQPGFVNYVQRDAYKNKVETNEDVIQRNTERKEEVSDKEIFELKADKLQKVLAVIDPNDKMILLMKYQDDLSIKEIKDVLEIGESAVKMRLKRAKEKVIEIYNKI